MSVSKNKLIADAVRSHTQESGLVVDIGFAQHPNPHLPGMIEGVDIVAVPVPEGYEKVHVCDLNTELLPFKSKEVNSVTMGCTLAHVANPLKTLGEINRVLKPGGVLVLSSPNPNYYWETILNIFYGYFKDRVSKAKHEEHFFEFSRYNIRTVAQRAGFEVVQELGCTFQLVKTPLRFSPTKYPGIAYEIVYVLKKIGEPRSYATFEGSKGIERVPTNLYG